MYAQVRTTQFQLDTCDTALAISRDFVVPAIERQAGNKGVIQLIDRASGTVILITLWETEAAMKAQFDRSHYMREQSVIIAGRAMAPPISETFEVDAQVG